jgi:hypothetical protein
MDYKLGDKVWTLEKGKFIQRVICRLAPYHVGTELLPGEPTSDPKTGMFINSHHHLKLEVGCTKKELLQNRIQLEEQRTARAQEQIAKSQGRITTYQDIWKNASES